MMKTFHFALLALLITNTHLFGYRLAPPEEQIIQSENGKYKLHVIPPKLPSEVTDPGRYYGHLFAGEYAKLLAFTDDPRLENMVCRAEFWSRTNGSEDFEKKWIRPLPNAIMP